MNITPPIKVVLVAVHPYPSPQAVPLANAYLKSSLAMDDGLSGAVRVELLDLLVDEDPEDCADRIVAENPAAVGFSCYVWNRAMCSRLAAALRRRSRAIRLFAGGPEPTADPGGMLEEAPLDFLIVGEGEVPFLEAVGRLAAGRDVAGVPGTAVRGESPVTQKPMALLDAIPSPYLAGILPAGKYTGGLWQLSRGCGFACSFCSDRKGDRGVRRFSLERLREELSWFVMNRVEQVFVLDSTFNQDVRRAKEILRLIGRTAPHIHFHFEARSEFIDEEMARLFAGINCSVQIGLQSADPKVQQGVRRAFNREDFTARAALLNEAGAVFGFDLIYGLPGDTLRGFRQSLDFALALYPNHLDIFPLAVLPGTELAATRDALGIDALPAPPYTVRGTPTFPPEDMAGAKQLASACDVFYSRGKAVAWFNAALAPLALSPSDFLERFGRLLAEKGEVTEEELSDEEIWGLQREFLGRCFAGKKLRRLLPVALDLADYHYHFAAALLAPQPEIPTDRELEHTDFLAEAFSLAPGARLARFSYEVFDLLEAGEVDLREFADCFTSTGSCAVIYPRGGEVFTESLADSFFLLLERLDGASPAGRAAAELAIPPEEAASFLEFAAAEGIVVRR